VAVRPLSATLRPRASWLPIAWALTCVTVLGVVFFSISWPYVDMYTNLREAATLSWPRYIANAFGRDVEYRPLAMMAIKLSYQAIGLRLWLYQILVLIQFAAVLFLLLSLFQPVGWRRGVAAVVALSCVIGLHTTRVLFGFWPLNHHSAGLVFLLLAAALALDPRSRDRDWLFFPLTLVALLVLESGVLLAPLLVILWWVKARGIGVRGVMAMAIGFAGYVAIRVVFGTMGAPPSVYTGSGLAFSMRSPEELRNIFEHAPWLFWLYNVLGTLLTVVASEPRAGVYRFIESLLRGQTALWQWLHVGSSLLTTVLIGGALVIYRPSSERDRQLIVVGLVLVVFGSALGALYTRDRIALSAGVGYGLLLYVALAAMLERLPASGWRQGVVACSIAVIGVAWVVRTSETYAYLRDIAWDFHLEWTDRFADLAGTTQPQSELLTAMRASALQSTPEDPRMDPEWTYAWFERRFSRGDAVAAGAPDAAADNAVQALSPPFDVRWKAEVDDETRLRLESELGFADPQQVSRDPRGLTWTYRLRRPTRDRVRAIVITPAIDDTARIDATRFEILD